MFSSSGKIKNIIFDFGEVIINLDFQRTLNAFRGMGAKIDSFEQVMREPFFNEFELGWISPAVFRDKLRGYIPNPVSDEELDDAWNQLLLDIPGERIKLLEKLKTRYRLFLLSNSNKIHYAYYVNNLRKEHGYRDFSGLFEKVYFSFDAGMVKPSLGIYFHVINKSRLNPEETIFIDDIFHNVEAAKKAGLHGYWLKKPETVLDVFKDGELLNFESNQV